MGGMIFGYPKDTFQTAEATIKFFCQEKVELPQVTFLTPFPGTRLRKEMLKAGQVLSGGWEKYDAITPLIKSKRLSLRQQAKAHWQIFRKTYSFFNIFKRLLPALLRLNLLHWLILFWFNLEFKKGSKVEAKSRGLICQALN